MGRVRVPFAGANGKQPGRKPRPQRKKRPKGAVSSGWALAGVAVSLVATWAFAALRLGRRSRANKTLLQTMLARPLLITEHGACRMDCRSTELCTASLLISFTGDSIFTL